MNHHSTDTIELIQDIFNEKECAESAKRHKFVQRSSSRLKGAEFAKALILPQQGNCESSLSELCVRICDFDIEAQLSAQALSERINSPHAVRFMQDVYARSLASSRMKVITSEAKVGNLLSQFSDVLIEDSSVVELNERLSSYYKGTNRGGHRACKSQVKIDLIHNFSSGLIVDAAIRQGNEPDQGFSERILRFIKRGDLVIRDLGYFVLDVLQAIHRTGAYFLTRVPPHVKVFLSENGGPLDLAAHIRKASPNNSLIELEGFLGDSKIPTRLVLYRVPEEVVNKRLRDAHRRAKSDGRCLSKAKRALLGFSIFATNCPAQMLPAPQVGTVYRIRWEIELIFKQWKSELKLHILKGTNVHRIQCLIWARLSTVVIHAMLCHKFDQEVRKRFAVELSPTKLLRHIMRDGSFAKSVSNNDLIRWANVLTANLKRLCKDKRQRKTMRERISTNERYYETVA